MKLAQGERIGQWTLQKQIGKGGNGVVWLANNSEARMAAIKFLHSDYFGKQREARFRDEIKFLTNESNRLGILPRIDSYEPVISTEEDRPWLATPFAKCFTDLELAGVAMLPELVRHIEAIAQTLVKLHGESKYHRDLKPENIFMLDGSPVIGDFGLVDFPDKDANTRGSEILGSRNYTAPELEGDAADTPAGPADVYSLSKTLWVLASSKRYPPPGTLRMDIPQLRFSNFCNHPRAGILDYVLERGTNHDPLKRPTMREFARELSEWLNPPTAESLKTDLTALSKEYENVFMVADRAKRDRDDLIAAAKVALVSFEPVLEQIATRIKDRTKIETYVGSADDLELHQFVGLAGGVRLVSRDTKGVRVTIGNDWAAFLQCFVQVEALDNDTIRIVVGYLVETTVYGDRLSSVLGWCCSNWGNWIKETTAPRGSALLANESKIFQAGLLNNLDAAISAFGESVKKLKK
jgi:serine/threonine-protein kinase